MTQAFYTAISGMAAGQNKITVVADNIANMNTIAFKSSSVNFSDIYYRTSSTGQAPTGSIGGKNPKQMGIGVQTASIQRDFSAGTTLTTGLNTDLCINGSSFFTVASPTVEVLYTRDGNFSIDANGNMITSAGYRLLGTDKSLNTISSTDFIKIPTYITTETIPSELNTVGDVQGMAKKRLSDLNGIKLGGVNPGTFNINLYPAGGGDAKTANIEIEEGTTVEDLLAMIKTEVKDQTGFDIEVSASGGRISMSVNTDDVASFDLKGGTSNVVSQLGFGKMFESVNADGDDVGVVQSEIINYNQIIGEGTPSSPNAENFNSVTINENGIIEVKYGNNDTISVMEDPDNPEKMIFKYTLNNGTVITGKDLTINDDLVKASNLQIQMASFVNPQGLTAEGNNTYSSAANSGMVLYGSLSSTAFGSVKSGVLEGSNVDLAAEFADMVVSQRAIEANSRVFTTTNEILQTLGQLAR